MKFFIIIIVIIIIIIIIIITIIIIIILDLHIAPDWTHMTHKYSRVSIVYAVIGDSYKISNKCLQTPIKYECILIFCFACIFQVQMHFGLQEKVMTSIFILYGLLFL